MTKKSFFVRLCLSASILFLAPTGANSQVTIGSGVLPQATLDIIGDTANVHGQAFRLIDGNQAPGKVLTVGENGIATWEEVRLPATTTRIQSFSLDPNEFVVFTVLLERVYLTRFTPQGLPVGTEPEGNMLLETLSGVMRTRCLQPGGRNFVGSTVATQEIPNGSLFSIESTTRANAEVRMTNTTSQRINIVAIPL